MTALMLSGCVSGASSSTTVTVTESQSTAETSASEAATEGIFASQFDPCEEFSDEQLAAAGLGSRLGGPTQIGNGIIGCSFEPPKEKQLRGVFLVATDQLKIEEIKNQKLSPQEWNDSESEGLYVHQMPSDGRQCQAAIDFQWGRFVVDYMETGSGWEPEVLCAESARILESLVKEMGNIK